MRTNSIQGYAGQGRSSWNWAVSCCWVYGLLSLQNPWLSPWQAPEDDQQRSTQVCPIPGERHIPGAVGIELGELTARTDEHRPGPSSPADTASAP